jgi:hypothetical protein
VIWFKQTIVPTHPDKLEGSYIFPNQLVGWEPPESSLKGTLGPWSLGIDSHSGMNQQEEAEGWQKAYKIHLECPVNSVSKAGDS